MRRAVFRSARRPITANHGRGALVLLSRSSAPSNHQQLHSKSRDYQEAAAVGTTAKLPESEPISAEKYASRNGVTIQDILERRAMAGRLVAMTAASADSDMFKAPVSFCGCVNGLGVD